ncbi:MAG TPA: ParA family protein [Candidatus Binatia bacterium]|nr:ParA family protein [Candidatus Binatia bacterium]
MSEPSTNSASSRPTKKKTDHTRRLQMLNRKGGAGKTTTAINLAEGLGRLGFRVLVVDMDANASLTKLSGIKLRDLPYSVYDLLMSPSSLLPTRNVILQPDTISYDILPGSENISYAEPSLLMAKRQQALRERLAEVDEDYDFVLLDTGGQESFIHTLGHVYADEVILPTEADVANWDTLELTLNSVRKIREDGLNPNMRIAAIVVTRYQQGTNFGNALLEKLFEQYREVLFPILVLQTVRVREAQGYGLPIVAYDPTSQPALAYNRLAEYIANGKAKI